MIDVLKKYPGWQVLKTIQVAIINYCRYKMTQPFHYLQSTMSPTINIIPRSGPTPKLVKRSSCEHFYVRLWIKLHCVLLWFPSKYHLTIMFEHSYCQIHFQSQNCSFKEFVHFWRKIPPTKRPFAWGGVRTW